MRCRCSTTTVWDVESQEEVDTCHRLVVEAG